MKQHAPIIDSALSWGLNSALVALGGILGTLSRYAVDTLLVQHGAEPFFPWPTFLINVSGSALLGFVMAWVEESEHAPGWLRPFAAIGFCGAYTTFSTMSVEILLLARQGHADLALTYLLASLICGILAVTLATVIGVHLFQHPDPAKRRGKA